ncbi:MAG: class I SAM-dependent methyltransferase [Hyphomonadaceae bacterium]|nr:class I SAM-dependent methyltransferase [Hyphomonadaceae bacterium]
MAQQPVSLALSGYAADASGLIPNWLKLDSAEVHAPVLHLFPTRPSRILDIGAGIGSDAAWLASRGHSIIALEPTDALREAGLEHHSGPRIEWLNDRLPDLLSLMARRETFDLVKLTAVWAHLDPDQRRVAMPNIASQVGKSGRLIMSIREGWSPANRPVFEAAVDETIRMAEANGLALIFRTESGSIQPANIAHGVKWHWLAFERPA